MSAEGGMWAAAIEYAFRAACMPPEPTVKQDTGGGCTPSEAADEWRFLTDTQGGWAESRAIICWINGVDPDVVRSEAIRRGISRGARYGLLTGEERKAMLAEIGARDAKILQEYAAGRPICDIAAEHKISMIRVQQIAIQNRVKRPKNNKWPGRENEGIRSQRIIERNKRIVEAWVAGVPMEQIAVDADMPPEAVRSVARRAGAKRPAWFIAAQARKNAEEVVEKMAGRNADILRRRASGESVSVIAASLGRHVRTIRNILSKPGSAVEDRGDSNSRAAGGGVSFHAQSMPAGAGG
jgi:FixJ family two-component response regulator